MHKVHGVSNYFLCSRYKVLEEAVPVLHVNQVRQVKIGINVSSEELFEGDYFTISSHFGAVCDMFLSFDCNSAQPTDDGLMGGMVVVTTVYHSPSNPEEEASQFSREGGNVALSLKTFIL